MRASSSTTPPRAVLTRICAVFHLAELGGAERFFSFFVEREVEGDNVRLSQEFLLRLDVGPRRVCVGVRITVVVDDLHVESSGAFGESGTDASHTDDAEGFVFGIVWVSIHSSTYPA